jgi:hypothetical protein
MKILTKFLTLPFSLLVVDPGKTRSRLNHGKRGRKVVSGESREVELPAERSLNYLHNFVRSPFVP